MTETAQAQAQVLYSSIIHGDAAVAAAAAVALLVLQNSAAWLWMLGLFLW